MKANTKLMGPKRPLRKQKSRNSRRFERFVLPSDGRVPAELVFLNAPFVSHQIYITDLSAFGIGVSFVHPISEKSASLRRRVEIRFDSGALLEGITTERSQEESQPPRLGIALKADGLRFEDLSLLPEEQILSLDEQIRPVVPVDVVGAVGFGLIMAGETGVPSQVSSSWAGLTSFPQGELRLVTPHCAVVHMPYFQPGLLAGLNTDLSIELPKGRFLVNSEISDIVETENGVDLVLSYTDDAPLFLRAYSEFYLDTKTRSYKAQLQQKLRSSGLLK